jgi:dTDP-4-dehydrorhamnose 3,5-epimerase
MPFIFSNMPIEGLVVVAPRLFPDDRGFFMETFKESDFLKAGINARFVQDNHSRSSKGTLRGLHFQKPPHAQAKLVRCIRGRLWDVAVDLRSGSPTYKKWHGVELSEESRAMFFIPAGFAHGFVALEDGTELQYKCSAEYNSQSDGGIRWDDPDLGVEWPLKDVLVSSKDAGLPRFKDINPPFKGSTEEWNRS